MNFSRYMPLARWAGLIRTGPFHANPLEPLGALGARRCASRIVARPTAPKKIFWSKDEDDLLRKGVAAHGSDWHAIAANYLPHKAHVACWGRWTRSLNPKLKIGPWTAEEDAKLVGLVEQHGPNWAEIAKHMDGRSSNRCQQRWKDALNPALKKGPWSAEEDAIIWEVAHTVDIDRYPTMVERLPGRSYAHVRNRYIVLANAKERAESKAHSAAWAEKARKLKAEALLKAREDRAKAKEDEKAKAKARKEAKKAGVIFKFRRLRAAPTPTQIKAAKAEAKVAAKAVAAAKIAQKQRAQDAIDAKLREAVAKHGDREWGLIADDVGSGLGSLKCKKRWQTLIKMGVLSAWTPEEDARLLKAHAALGDYAWNAIAAEVGGGRSGWECKHRVKTDLPKELNTSPWTPEEDAILMGRRQMRTNLVSMTERLRKYNRSGAAVKKRCEELGWPVREDVWAPMVGPSGYVYSGKKGLTEGQK